MFIKATQEKFEQYGKSILSERQLGDGDYIKHFELTGNSTAEQDAFFITIREDLDIKIYTDDEMTALTTENNE
jgi:hypothetical protein